MKKLRCAIYTRKSTEEGLDMAFNSLDAQREACEAYVTSQKAEGWVLVPTAYDDGGFSGGTMDRPALVQLLADVRAGKVDVIVVYKVDRLTRALSDFARIVDVLDAAGASFVSVTQAFNTTTSMGRLTLNVLLSFAQFEREVIAERVIVDTNITHRKRGARLVIAKNALAEKMPDPNLVALIAKAHRARAALFSNSAARGNRHIERLARLAYLAPDITSAILDGTQPATLTSRSLLKLPGLPLEWTEQRKMLKFA